LEVAFLDFYFSIFLFSVFPLVGLLLFLKKKGRRDGGAVLKF